uniref:Uncharacterized protein n=1 Tax=Anguilla anguilla TaxID=7936 RepID=A0A0E9SNI1_ANGAN
MRRLTVKIMDNWTCPEF